MLFFTKATASPFVKIFIFCKFYNQEFINVSIVKFSIF